MGKSKPNAVDPGDAYAFSDSDSDAASAASSIINPAAEALLDRCSTLLEEVESFLRQLRRNNVESSVELRVFLNQIKAEHRCIQGLCLEAADSTKSRHGVKACNLPYLEALWAAAKSTTGITALCKTFGITEQEGAREGQGEGRRGRRKKSSVTVDVVAQNGLQWIKVSLLTERRLLFELAKAGWEGGYDSDDSAASASAAPLATSSLSLTTLTATLVRAAAQHRVQYLHPTIHLLLPNLHPSPDTPELNAFLTTLTSLGAHIQCGTSPLLVPRSIPDLVADLSSPSTRRVAPLTDPLNLDTTILLALVSDISCTAAVPHEPRFHPAILKQLALEAAAAMLPTHLWPVLAGHRLVCTSAARARFDEIVSIVGSETERARAAALVEVLRPRKAAAAPPMSADERCAAFQALCVHPLPAAGLALPITTLDEEEEGEEGEGQAEGQAEVRRRVAAKLSSVNRSVFMAGWRKGLTTVSSNRGVAKIIEALVGEEEVGPDVYVVETARSLVGKAKRIEV
ncbi:hypothetical protein EDC01DRAFT_724869 [Geopyxis carbonaria]|nr:hypothetical protein EDC01DRAFT_724869 [Geopyxis carbonaria]